MGKYDPLRDYLADRASDEEPMTFGQVERLVGPLPNSSRENRAWWGNDSYRTPSIACQAASIPRHHPAAARMCQLRRRGEQLPVEPYRPGVHAQAPRLQAAGRRCAAQADLEQG